MRSIQDVGLKDVVYAPDLKNRSLEGNDGIFTTIASFLVGPIRLMTRVVHNIFILPADMLVEYSNSLLLVGCVVGAIGLLDWIIYGKWPLIVSQIIVIIIATLLKKSGNKGVEAAQAKREVEVDTSQVEELCNEIFDELNTIVGKDL